VQFASLSLAELFSFVSFATAISMNAAVFVDELAEK
jgi:hypothetical protein